MNDDALVNEATSFFLKLGETLYVGLMDKLQRQLHSTGDAHFSITAR